MTTLPKKVLIWTYWLMLAAGALLGRGHPVIAQSIPRFEPAECMFDTGGFWSDDAGVECGYVLVPERRYEFDEETTVRANLQGEHSEPGEVIRLATVILRSSGAEPAPDPLIVAQGGPGGSTIESHYHLLVNHPLRDTRDIVLFDQRGTLYSQPNLICTESLDALPDLLTADEEEAAAIMAAATSACRARLEDAGIDVAAYNSLENAADVDAVRQALGYDEINFYGVSYGTLLGFHLMRNFPDSVRSVILDGVVPPQVNFVTQVFASEERVFREFFAACSRDPACVQAYPDLEARFQTVVAQLNENPASLLLQHPESGARIPVLFTGDDLVDFLFQMFYVTGSPAVLPAVIAQAEAGRFDYPAAVYPTLIFAETFSDGMYNSVICTEDADFRPSDAALDGVRPIFAAGAVDELEEFLSGCALWNVPALAGAVDAPIESDIPALLLSGNFDPITPPGFADVAADTLSRARHVVLPDGGHGVAFGVDSCVDLIVDEFLSTGSADVDTSCLDEEATFDFVAPNVLIVPLIARLNTGSAAAVRQVGLAALLLVGLMSALLVWPGSWLIRRLRQAPGSMPAVKRRQSERWLVVGFILLALLTMTAIALTFIIAAVVNWNMALLAALPGWARGLTALTWVLAALAVAMVISGALLWWRRAEPLWSRLYYLFLVFCAVGYVALLFVNDLAYK